MKASDIFIGIVDFFATLLPGVFLVATFPAAPLLKSVGMADASSGWSLPRWAILGGLGYAVGQLVHLVGAKIATGVYPWLLTRFKPKDFDSLEASAIAILSAAFSKNEGSEITRRSAAVVRHLDPELILEADRLEAAAKFARGLSLVAVVIALQSAATSHWLLSVIWLAVAVIAFIRFIDRRLVQNRYVCELLVVVTTYRRTAPVETVAPRQ